MLFTHFSDVQLFILLTALREAYIVERDNEQRHMRDLAEAEMMARGLNLYWVPND